MKVKSAPHVILILLLGCASSNLTEVVKYPSKKKQLYQMDVPKGYLFSGVAGGSDVEHKYIYSDSSLIFITDFPNTPNYSILREEGLYNSKFNANVLAEDTLRLEGRTAEGFWKDITYGKVSIGYQKVPESRKEDFDNALESFRKK